MRIQEIEVYDQGSYVCRAENSHGRAEVSVMLTVDAKPKTIEIVHEPHDMAAPVGATVQLPCRAEGNHELVNGH